MYTYDRLLYQSVTFFVKDFFPYCTGFSDRVKLQCVAVRISPASDYFLKAKKNWFSHPFQEMACTPSP